MAHKDNQIDIDHLKSADLTAGELHDIVRCLEASLGHLILPVEVDKALRRLMEKTKC
jgi:hypothetical protein